MIGLLDKERQNRNSKISTRITKAHKPCLEGKDLNSWTWFELELELQIDLIKRDNEVKNV
jgi:hypothetical protein